MSSHSQSLKTASYTFWRTSSPNLLRLSSSFGVRNVLVVTDAAVYEWEWARSRGKVVDSCPMSAIASATAEEAGAIKITFHGSSPKTLYMAEAIACAASIRKAVRRLRQKNSDHHIKDKLLKAEIQLGLFQEQPTLRLLEQYVSAVSSAAECMDENEASAQIHSLQTFLLAPDIQALLEANCHYVSPTGGTISVENFFGYLRVIEDNHCCAQFLKKEESVEDEFTRELANHAALFEFISGRRYLSS